MTCAELVTTTDSTDRTFQAALYCYKLQVLAFAQAARTTLHGARTAAVDGDTNL